MKKLGLLVSLFFMSMFCVANTDFQARVTTIENSLKGVQRSKDLNIPFMAHYLQGKNVDEYMQVALESRKDRGFQYFTMQDFYNGVDRLECGYKIGDKNRSIEDIKRTAYHELGHAVVIAYLCKDRIVSRVNIEQHAKVSYSGIFTTLGFVETNSIREDLSAIVYSKEDLQLKLKESIAILLAGGCSEQHFFENQKFDKNTHVSNLFLNPHLGGISELKYIMPAQASIETYLTVHSFCGPLFGYSHSDLSKATALAKAAVLDQDDAIKKITGVGAFFVSIAIASSLCTPISPMVIMLSMPLMWVATSPGRTAQKELLLESYDQAQAIITNNQDKIDLLAKELIKKRSLSGQRVYDVLGIKRPKYYFEESVDNKK